jgi:hypothetical protein
MNVKVALIINGVMKMMYAKPVMKEILMQNQIILVMMQVLIVPPYFVQKDYVKLISIVQP